MRPSKKSNKSSAIKAILLCAGYGTRLYPLTENQPKALLPIAGKPILEWILKRVAEVKGVETAYVVSNHRFVEAFRAWAPTVRTPWPIEVLDDQTTTNENRLGAIGDLAFVLKQKRIEKEDLLVLAGDNLFDFSLKEFVRLAALNRPHPVIAIHDVGDYQLAKQYGIVRLTEDGRVMEFYEKPKDPLTTLASCGIYWFPGESRVLLDTYLADGHNADQPGHYMRWLASKQNLYGTPLKGRWVDIGDHTSYGKADELFRGAAKIQGKGN